MDSNKDVAEECMGIDQAAMESGDLARAVKFLTKAQRLYPNPQVDAYLRASCKENAEESTYRGPRCSKDSREENPHRIASNHSESSAASTTPSGHGGSEASPEQIEIVGRIKRTKDYYQILSLSKDCSPEDVCKAYRKISLKVHPDKNKAAGAEEAFKAVSKAFMNLSNAELRKKYDRCGQDEDHEQQIYMRRRNQQAGNPFRFHQGMVDMDDICSGFFDILQPPQGGAFSRAHFTRPADGDHGQENFSNVLGLKLAFFLFSQFLSYGAFSGNVLQYFYLVIPGLGLIQLLSRLFWA